MQMSTSVNFLMTLVILILVGTVVGEAKGGKPLITSEKNKPVYFRLRSDGIPDHCLVMTNTNDKIIPEPYCSPKDERYKPQMWSKFWFGDEGLFALQMRDSKDNLEWCIAYEYEATKNDPYNCPAKLALRRCRYISRFAPDIAIFWYTEPVPNSSVWEFVRTATNDTHWHQNCLSSVGNDSFGQLQIRYNETSDVVEFVLNPRSKATESMASWKFDYFCDP